MDRRQAAVSAGINAQVEALTERARMLMQLRRAPEAEREARAALAEDPQNPAGHIMLALARLLQEDMDGALMAANRGIGMIPDHWVGHWVAGLILAETGRQREALVALQNALALDPDEPTVYEWLARVHLNIGELPAAAGAAEYGLRLAPEDADLAEIMALTLAQLGDKTGAREHASRAVRLALETPAVHRAYGLVMLATGDHRAAAEAFRELLRLAPEHEDGPVLLLGALNQRNPLRRLDDFLDGLRLMPRRSVLRWFTVIWFPPCFVITILLTLATWLSWVGQVVTTLSIHRDPRDRRLLGTAEVRAAWIGAGLLGGGLVLLASAAAFQSPGTVMAGVAMLGLITPVQETVRLSGMRRTVFGACTGALTAAQAVMIPLSYFGVLSLVPILLTFYASLASTWAGNLLDPRTKA
jgi:tetratricopeptide (TPR) repeat protein